MPCTAALRRRGARLGSRTTQRDELRPLCQEPNDELDEPVLGPFAPVPQPGDSDKERATAAKMHMAPSVVLPSTTCHAPTPDRAADIKTTNMATARRIAIQYAADQRTAERFAAACSPRLPQWTTSESALNPRPSRT